MKLKLYTIRTLRWAAKHMNRWADRLDPSRRELFVHEGKPKHIIVAGHIIQAKNVAEQNGWRGSDWICLTEPAQLKGLEGPLLDENSPYTLHFVGTWQKRSDLNELLKSLAIAGFDVNDRV